MTQDKKNHNSASCCLQGICLEHTNAEKDRKKKNLNHVIFSKESWNSYVNIGLSKL